MSTHLRIQLAPFILAAAAVVLSFPGRPCAETLAEIGARLGRETSEAYAASPFSALSKDYFLRLSRDPDARPGEGEIEITSAWSVMIPNDADPLAERMAGHLIDFLDQRMKIRLALKRADRISLPKLTTGSPDIILLDSGGGQPGAPESFTIKISAPSGAAPAAVMVHGADPAGLRDGIVRLVDMIGFREAPFITPGELTVTPRLPVRLGAVPSMGSFKDLVFLGYNAVFAGGGNLHQLSNSDAIPALAARRAEGLLAAGAKAAADASQYGLKTYAWLDTRQKFPKNDPVLAAHPEIRGALTWSADGEYVLCTEHPLVRRFLHESVAGLFRGAPDLDGVVVIIGGEGFYHCFMRPFGVQKGHTNCERCEKLGPDTVVANLVNGMAEAARAVNPKAEVVIWPYSAEHVWSSNKTQSGLIDKLKPGVALLTEIEKDEYVEKEGGVRKHLWDYSIDLIGPGARAREQIALCEKRGIPVYLKSEPELAFEAPRLPHIPCMDRWVDRAEALASCGARGAWVFPAFRPNYGTSAAEVAKYSWWSPTPTKDDQLNQLAARISGAKAAPHIREAWRRVSEAIEYVPELPPYYTGPYYLGPAHPMCADPDAELPQVFYGYYLFMAEMTDAEGLKKRPTYFTKPRGDVTAFLNLYRKMEAALKTAADEMNAARPLIDERHKLMFEAEDSPLQWFYRTARTHANFYESCILRDRLLDMAKKDRLTDDERAGARKDTERWLEILKDERENTQAALPIMEADVRLDPRYGGDHTFEHGAEMIRAKLTILEDEINKYVPAVSDRLKLSRGE